MQASDHKPQGIQLLWRAQFSMNEEVRRTIERREKLSMDGCLWRKSGALHICNLRILVESQLLLLRLLFGVCRSRRQHMASFVVPITCPLGLHSLLVHKVCLLPPILVSVLSLPFAIFSRHRCLTKNHRRHQNPCQWPPLSLLPPNPPQLRNPR